jgi:hypothetical protein
MKVTLFLVALCLMSAGTAHGQAGASALNGQPVVYEFPAHTQRAAQVDMAKQENLLGQAGYTYAQGERPLWEFPRESRAVPLGDIARTFRKEHESVKKSEIVWQN